MKVTFEHLGELRFWFSYKERMVVNGFPVRVTEAKLSASGGDYVVISSSVGCSSLDQFKKAVGRKKALSKLLEDAGFIKEDRAKVWTKYFKEHKK